jgi:subtilisin family serine protease
MYIFALVTVMAAAPAPLAAGGRGDAAGVANRDGGVVTAFRDGGAPRRVWRPRRASVELQPGRYDQGDGAAAVDVVVGPWAIVQLASGAAERSITDAALETFVAAHALSGAEWLMKSAGLVRVRSARPDEDGVEVVARLQRSGDAILMEAFPDVAFAHRLAQEAFVPNDPRYPGQFYLDEVRIEGAWAFGIGSADVVVSVVDNGCDLEHPDLKEKMDPGHDVITGDEDPSFTPNAEGNNHGTACAGIIAAVANNGRDVAGTCPLCRLTCTRMLGAPGEPIPLSADVRAFEHALEDDVAVVNNSWGFVDAIAVPQVLAAAIIEVQQNGRGGKGAVVVFASGNDSREIGDDELLAVPGVLGVGATNNLGELTQFSNRGRSVDVTAPTGTVTTDVSGPDGDDPGDVTVRFGGTSSAAPVVAGIAGLLLAANPDLTADDVNSVLEATAEQAAFARPDASGHDIEYGFGLVRADLAMAFVVGDDDDDAGPGQGGCGGCGDAGAAGVFALPLLRLRRRRLRRQGCSPA